jgi:hypothetical protein
MATIGNLFVNIGASTAGLEQGMQKARGEVKGLAQDVASLSGPFQQLLRSLGIEADGVLGPLTQIGGILAKMGEGASGASATGEALAKTAAKTDDLAKAQSKLSKTSADYKAASLYDKIARDRAAAVAKQEKLNEAINASAKAYRGIEGKIGRAKTDEEVNRLMRDREPIMARLNGQMRERDKLVSELAKKEAMQSRAGAVLASRGISMKEGQTPKTGWLDKFFERNEKAKKSLESLGKATAEQASEGGPFAGLRNILSALKNPYVALTAATLVFAGGGLAVGIAMAKQAEALKNEATALGITATRLQELRDIYSNLGVASGVAENTMKRFSSIIAEAAEGSDEAKSKFSRIGLDATALAAMDSADAFDAVIRQIRQLNTQAEKMKALRDMFGRGGTNLGAAVNSTAEDFEKAQQAANKLKLPNELYMELAETSNGVTNMVRGFQNILYIFAREFGPAVDSVSKSLFDLFTTDTDGLVSGMRSLAYACAIAVDLVALIVNGVRALWNLLQMVVEVVGAIGTYLTSVVMKGIEYILWGWETFTLQSHENSKAMGQMAKEAKAIGDELLKSSGKQAMELGQSIKDAFVPDATLAMMNKAESAVDKTRKAIESDPITVKSELDQKKIADIKKQLDELRERVATVGMSDSQKMVHGLKKSGATEADLAEAAKLQQQLKIGELQAKMAEDIKAAQEDYYKLTESAADYAYNTAKAAGASEQVADALAKQAQEAENIRKRTDTVREITQTMEELKRKTEEVGLTEDEQLLRKLQMLQADDAQIKKAQEYMRVISQKTAQASALKGWQEMLDGMNKELLDITSSREEQLRRMAEAAGKLGTDLDEAVSNALALEKSLQAARDAKANREDAAKQLKDMEAELRKAQIGEKAFRREEFAKKVNYDKDMLSKYDGLQSQLDSIQQTQIEQFSPDQLDTVFGALKTASVIASNLSAGAANAAAGATGAPMAQSSNAPAPRSPEDRFAAAMETANAYLKDIADNTRDFGKVLN